MLSCGMRWQVSEPWWELVRLLFVVSVAIVNWLVGNWGGGTLGFPFRSKLSDIVIITKRVCIMEWGLHVLTVSFIVVVIIISIHLLEVVTYMNQSVLPSTFCMHVIIIHNWSDKMSSAWTVY